MKSTNPDSLRDYGLPDSEVVGRPFAKLASPQTTCPNCGCEQVMTITVRVKQPLLRGGAGSGYYLGCPACPWASPMGMHAGAPPTDEKESAT